MPRTRSQTNELNSLSNLLETVDLEYILDNFIDIKSLLSFEQTNKSNKQLVDEAFKRKRHLELKDSKHPPQDVAFKLLKRCGPKLKSFFMKPSFLTQNFKKTKPIVIDLAIKFPKLIKLPFREFIYYKIYIETLEKN